MNKYISLLILLLLSFICSPSFARKKPRHAAEGNTMMVEPDHMAPKAKPDRIAQRHEEPVRRTGHINTRHREGIDVSHYQYDIDWECVASEGNVSYAYIKATEGASLVDEYYQYNVTEARKYGLSVGAYHFFRPNVDISTQFENFTGVVKKSDIDLVPLVDIETTGNCSSDTFLSRLREFIARLEKHYGRKPLLYTFQNFYNKHLCGEFTNYPWMIAKYKDDPPYLNDDNDYIIWQYTQSGRIPGVRGNVDRSCLVGKSSLKVIQM